MHQPRSQMALHAKSQAKQLRQVAEPTVAQETHWFQAQG
jgi:hypothetical protein